MGGCTSQVTVATFKQALTSAHAGDVELLKSILDKQESTNKRTMLQVACIENNVKDLQLLLDHKANVTIRTADNLTCLHLAADCCSYECLEILLIRGVMNVDITANTKQLLKVTPLQFLVARLNHVQRDISLREKCIKLLCSHGADSHTKQFTYARPNLKEVLCTAESFAFHNFHAINRTLLPLLANNEKLLAAQKLVADAEAKRKANSEQYAQFVTDAAERVMRIVLRVKNIPLSEQALSTLKEQMVAELMELPVIDSISDEVRTTTLNNLANVLADEIVLMVDEQGRVAGGVLKTAAAACYTQIIDAVKAKATAAQAVTAATAAASAGAAAGGVAKDTKNPLLEHAADVAGEIVAGQAIDALAGLIPLPFAGAIIGAGVKMAIKKAATSGGSEKTK